MKKLKSGKKKKKSASEGEDLQGVQKRTTATEVMNQVGSGAMTPWDELSADEKIDRTRQIVKHLMERLDYKENEVRSLREVLFDHGHDAAGRPTVPAHMASGRGLPYALGGNSVGPASEDTVYF